MSGPQETPTFYSLQSETSSVQFMTELRYFKRVLISGCDEYADSIIEQPRIRIPDSTVPRFYKTVAKGTHHDRLSSHVTR
jgi:hypothetical protein